MQNTPKTLTSDDGTSPEPIRNPSANDNRHIRSCLSCRSRKIKCDRQKPCSNCIRQGTTCNYPSGPGRAPKVPRQRTDPRILDRLSRMENLVRDLKRQADSSGDTNVGSSSLSDLDQHPSRFHSQAEIKPGSEEQQHGRLVMEDSKSSYVSNIFWANISDQIEDLRDFLHESNLNDENGLGNDDNDKTTHEQPPMQSSDAAIMGFRSLMHSLDTYHPSLMQAAALLEIFQENVLPLVRIFHMPTLNQIFWDTLASLEQPDKNTEALLFAIYYSAVISMKSEQCLKVLGIPRTQALSRFLFAIQQALARANLLSTQSMILLQAAFIFVSALRSEDDSRTVWSLTSLIHHIARSMGLHRDGTVFKLSPLETELRRRFWWHLCLLDMRSSEYHGNEPIVQENTFDTRFPLNINDEDMTASTTTPPKEREEATEMTFCLVRCESMRILWKISNARTTSLPNQTQELPFQQRLMLVDDLSHRIHERYVRYCNISIPFEQATAVVARMMSGRAWLMVHYPLTRQTNQTSVPINILWQRLFKTSVELLELSNYLSKNKDIRKWSWYSQTFIQWHAIALVLSVICSRPPSPESDRAWACVLAIYDRLDASEDEKKGVFWRPIKRLMAKARHNRELQSTNNAGIPPRRNHGKDSFALSSNDLFQADEAITLPGAQGFDLTSQKANSMTNPNFDLLQTDSEKQSLSWLSTPQWTTPISRQDTLNDTPFSAQLFGEEGPHGSGDWNINLEDLDMDLMEFCFI